ncbi:WD repeat-containing protein 91-like [Teleopsis dalmanni]|uniref:WD repeat-containing protein 91-like n=1 Tax=Teleopsis dalmanni TaxID=139649 RepID=UPI0018CE581F|nr:WD repeat-containing protein 91-like [Teleopsis dalmanni]XP_037949513.1 WD repeat-containing protein 91-like [Teleopsis dalmanni]
MAQVEFLDTILKEYLIFRGFSNTLKALDADLKSDKDFGFRAEKIMEQFNQYIVAGDLQGLTTLWGHLDNFLFTKLEHTYLQSVKKFESSLYKLYLITAHTNNKPDKIKEFFSKMSDELHQQSEWKEWFYFPFCTNPEESPVFSPFFTKQWQDTFQISLRNFLSMIYQCMPKPTFVYAEHEAMLLKHLQEENATLKARIQQMQQQQQSTASGSNPNLNATSDIATRKRTTSTNPQTLDDIPVEIRPPSPLLDDFYVIATEVNNMRRKAEVQARGIRMLLRGMGADDSLDTKRKDKSDKKDKRRSGSAGRSWM